MDPHQRDRFFQVHAGLEREGPGSDASTRRALALAGLEGEAARRPLTVADLGCGPGAQTRTLADALPAARITAVDLHPPYVEGLSAALDAADLADRVAARVGDLREPPFAPASLDLIWCEGAAYFLGLPGALHRWRPLLRPGGVVGLSEPCWCVDDPGPEAEAQWREEYPSITDRAGNRAHVADAGWRLLGDFVLPADDWRAYYEPLAARCEVLEARWADDPVGRAVLAETRAEIDAWRRLGDAWGYQFLVVTPDD
jgi:trans-aconitate methyltransferase